MCQISTASPKTWLVPKLSHGYRTRCLATSCIFFSLVYSKGFCNSCDSCWENGCKFYSLRRNEWSYSCSIYSSCFWIRTFRLYKTYETEDWPCCKAYMGRLLNSKRVKTRRVPCPTCIFVSKRFWSTSKTNKCIKPLYVISIHCFILACLVCKC